MKDQWHIIQIYRGSPFQAMVSILRRSPPGDGLHWATVSTGDGLHRATVSTEQSSDG